MAAPMASAAAQPPKWGVTTSMADNRMNNCPLVVWARAMNGSDASIAGMRKRGRRGYLALCREPMVPRVRPGVRSASCGGVFEPLMQRPSVNFATQIERHAFQGNDPAWEHVRRNPSPERVDDLLGIDG